MSQTTDAVIDRNAEAKSQEPDAVAYLPFDLPRWKQYEHRMKRLMSDVGVPFSNSLFLAMWQLIRDVNHIDKNAHPTTKPEAPAVLSALLEAAVEFLSSGEGLHKIQIKRSDDGPQGSRHRHRGMAKRLVGYEVTGGELAPRAYAIYEDVPESMSDEAMSTQIDDLTALNKKLTTDLTALALDWQERAEKASIALAAEQAINKDLKIELDEALAYLAAAHGKFCKIAGGEAWTDTCLDGYRKTPGGLREFAESAAKEIDRSIEAGTVRD